MTCSPYRCLSGLALANRRSRITVCEKRWRLVGRRDKEGERKEKKEYEKEKAKRGKRRRKRKRMRGRNVERVGGG